MLRSCVESESSHSLTSWLNDKFIKTFKKSLNSYSFPHITHFYPSVEDPDLMSCAFHNGIICNREREEV